MTINQWVDRLSKWKDQEQEICINLWCREDIYSRAEELREMGIIPESFKINNDTADDILTMMETNQDCSMGVSWDTVDYYIEEQPE